MCLHFIGLPAVLIEVNRKCYFDVSVAGVCKICHISMDLKSR